MTSVDQNRKKKLERLKKKFESKIGKILSEQEILDRCIEFSNIHIDELVQEYSDIPELTPELKKQILLGAQDCKLYDLDKTDDELIYGIKED